MLKKSNLDEVKSIATLFLYQDIEETDFSPIVVIHPIFESGIISIMKDGKPEFINITESSNNLLLVQKEWENNIMKQDSVYDVYMIIRKSYRLTFLKFVKDYLSKKDMSELLAHAWVSSENPNQDTNVSLETAVQWFREADKKVLMTKEDYAYYQSLPQTITAYRGVAEGRNPKGLSWTCNRKTAEWFANRFSRGNKGGYVQTVTVDKSCVLAYFNTRNEDELVLDILSKNISINVE